MFAVIAHWLGILDSTLSSVRSPSRDTLHPLHQTLEAAQRVADARQAQLVADAVMRYEVEFVLSPEAARGVNQ